MLALIRAFIDIALHRRGPEDLPASSLLFGLAFAAYLGTAAVALQQPAFAMRHPVMLLAVDTALTLAFIQLALKTFRHERRFLQTATALFGAHTLFNLLGLPLAVWSSALQTAQADVTAPAMFLILLIIWRIDVSAFIFSRALGRPYVLAIGIVLGYELLAYSVQIALFPPLNLQPAN